MIRPTLGPIIELLDAHREGEERHIDIFGLLNRCLVIVTGFVDAFGAGQIDQVQL